MGKIIFRLTESVKVKLTEALHKYGDFEIGGILIRKKIDENSFEIVDASVSDEDRRFSFVSFIRGTKKSERLLKKTLLQRYRVLYRRMAFTSQIFPQSQPGRHPYDVRDPA